MRTYLMPIYDSRKSFYNKAVVEDDSMNHGGKLLYSYETRVAMADTEDYEVELYPGWDHSQTTLRHVKEFLRQNGFKAETKAQIEKDYA